MIAEMRLRARSVRKRDGSTVQDFDPRKIERAVLGAWKAVDKDVDTAALSVIVGSAVMTLPPGTVDVETIQDAVEVALMRHNYYSIAKAYILYRQKRAEERLARDRKPDPKAISDYIHAGKYARYQSVLGRREVYPETVDRNEGMHLRKFPHLEEEIRRAYGLVREQRLLPSMRSMQFAGEAIEVNHNRMYNCCATLVDRLEVFNEALFLLLSGSGVGYSVQFEHVDKLPALMRIDEHKIRHHVVGDNIEGWADALKALVHSYTTGEYVEFAYNRVRAAGAVLRVSGGKAPGHVPLKLSLERIRAVLDGAQGRKLRPIECHRIICHAADAVLSGGIRRSAMIALFSLDDSEMMNCKTGDWFSREPWLANANNSVVLDRKNASQRQFKRIFQMTRQWGEPGFYFTDDIDYVTNPCFHPETRLWTADGYVRVIDLFNGGKSVSAVADCRAGKGSALTGMLGVASHEATPVFLTQKDAPVYDVITEHGYSVRVTETHEFPTPSGRKQLRHLEVGSPLFLPSAEGAFGANGKAYEGLVLGMYVGDGTATHDDGEAFVDVWEQDFGLLDNVGGYINAIVKDVPTYGHRADYGPMKWMDGTPTEGGVEKKRMGGVRLHRWLKGLADGEDASMLKQRVPDFVWRGSREFIAGYLQGLFITDGMVLLGGKGSGATLSVRLAQANEELLKDVQVLLSMFGIVSRIYPRMDAGPRLLPDGHGGLKEYDCKATFELILSRPNVIAFRDKIGLVGWKKDVLDTYLKVRGESCRKPERFITKIKEIRPAGRSDVYCLTQPDTNVVTANGLVTGQCCEIGLYPILTVTSSIMETLKKAGRAIVQLGQKLTGWAFCNLCEINAAKLTSFEDFVEVARAATFIGTLQASYTNMPYLGPVSEEIAKRDALLGIGMTGMLDAPAIACNPIFQQEIAGRIKQWNIEFAALIGINTAARTTTVKPSGTTSLELGCVGSGHHPHHAKRYIRRVIADRLETVFQAFKEVNPHMCVKKPDGKWVIEFPVKAPEGAIVKADLGAIEFLEMVRSTQTNWVRPGTARSDVAPGLSHNVSNTAVVRDNEWEPVAEYLWQHRDAFTGVSLVPATSDKDYAFAPCEEITTEADETRWNELLASYKPLDYSTLHETTDETSLTGEIACAGGACAV